MHIAHQEKLKRVASRLNDHQRPPHGAEQSELVIGSELGPDVLVYVLRLILVREWPALSVRGSIPSRLDPAARCEQFYDRACKRFLAGSKIA